jgi:hypothetical protein
VQLASPWFAAKKPGAQTLHACCPGSEKLPAWQTWHDVEPGTLLNWPAAHVVATDAPVVATNVPAGASVHCREPVVPANEPAGHAAQLVCALADDAVPTAHVLQLTAPATALKVPGPHAICCIAPGAGTKNPGLASTHEPPEKYFPAGHVVATGMSQFAPVNPTLQAQLPLPVQLPLPPHVMDARQNLHVG